MAEDNRTRFGKLKKQYSYIMSQVIDLENCSNQKINYIKGFRYKPITANKNAILQLYDLVDDCILAYSSILYDIKLKSHEKVSYYENQLRNLEQLKTDLQSLISRSFID